MTATNGMSDVFRFDIASSEEVRDASFGTVVRPDLLDRTGRAVRGGLLCDLIFGPEGSWSCRCGRLQGTENVGFLCIACDQPVHYLQAIQTGHIDLVSPVAHPLYFRTLARLLNFTLDGITYRDCWRCCRWCF